MSTHNSSFTGFARKRGAFHLFLAAFALVVLLLGSAPAAVLAIGNAQATQVTVGDINMFSCSALTVDVSGSFSSAWDKASLVDGSNRAFAFNGAPGDVLGDGTNNRRVVSISGFNGAINLLRFFDAPSFDSRVAMTVSVYYSSSALTSLNPADYTPAVSNYTLGPTENSVADRPTHDSYVAKTNPAGHPLASDPGSNTSKAIGYADVTGLTIPAGTQGLLLELYSPRTFGVALSEIQAFPVSIDYGDAPDTYRTIAGSNGANHIIAGTLKLGSITDAEGTGFPGVNADGDDLNNTDDEDSLATPLPLLNTFATSYSLTGIPVLNNTGSPAFLYGWVNFNRNGVFDASEGVSTTVPASASTQSVSLNWTGRSGTVAGQSYVRLRFSPQAGLAATGQGGAGEVEDYPLTIVTGGTVVVTKNTVGGNGSFPFTSTLPGAGSFSLATSANTASRTFGGVAPGTYAISETVPAGWTPTGATCGNGTPNAFTVAAGATVTCIFTNTQSSTITVAKRTVGGDGSFPFASTIGAAPSFILTTTANSASRSFAGLLPGSYAVTETPPVGWDSTGATCDNGNLPGAINLAAGVNVRCTFTNTQRGSLTVVKTAIGGDGVFTFTSPTLPSVVLTTTNGAAQQSLSNLLPGAYSLTETVPAGWRLDSATCSDGSSLDSIAITPGENVTCSFQNTKLDTIVVYKVAAGGDATFPFTSTIPEASSFSITTTNGTGIKFFNDVQPGTYAISETAPAGWTLADVVCSNGADPANLVLAAGETVVCSFGNEKDDTIIVEKRTVGGDGSFSFTSDIPGASSFSLTTTNNVTRTSFTVPPDATYSISESVPAGWDLTAATCSNGNSPGSVRVGAGETVTCTFTNVKLAQLTVVKDTVGGDGTFDMVSTTLTPTVFSLTTISGTAQRTFIDFQPGLYDVSETVPTGWDQTGAACSNGGAPNNVTLSAGDVVTCTLQNTKRGAVVVVKQAVGGDEIFHFASQTLSPSPFNLTTVSGTAQITFTNVVSGVYDVAETVPAGWDLATPVCSDGSAVGSIGVQPGETVTCTFTNTRRGSLTVIKNAVGGDGRFDFTSNAFPGSAFSLTTVLGAAQVTTAPLVPGTYAVTETVPAGWSLTSATCSDGSNPASIAIGPGENVTCRFVNTQGSSLTVVKTAVGGDGTFAFTSQTLGGFVLTTSNGTAQQVFAGLAAGTFSISETVPAGWDLTAATCSDGSSPASIGIAAGESVTCTFQNTKRGSLTVVKNAVGGDGTFAFTSQALGNFGLTTAGGTAQQVFADLAQGPYDVNETVSNGWSLTSATCSDGSNPAAVAIGAGESVICTFTNRTVTALGEVDEPGVVTNRLFLPAISR